MASTRPNIIFILIDDMGWKDVGCYGSSFYDTPVLDQLASDGVRFTDAYCASPVCSPTRASLLSGKYPARVGVTDWIDWGHVIHPAQGLLVDAPYVDHLPTEEKSLATTLKEHGYATWHVGKWHLGDREYYPDRHGFDVNLGGCEWGFPVNGFFSPWGLPTLSEGQQGQYLQDRLTDEAISLIKENRDKPFFLNLWYYSVHIPIEAKDEHIALYKQKAKEMGIDTLEAFEEGEHFPCDHKKDKRIVRRIIQSDPTYAAMIYSLDQNIGRVLDTLRETGIEEDTIVIFTSDNGGLATAEGSPTCNAPLSEGKGWMYEGGTREPLLVYWPGVTSPGRICDVPVTSPDFYPTILEMAGLPLQPEQHVDGVSLVPLLQGENKAGNSTLDREAIYWHYPHYGNQGGRPGASIRRGDYKLIYFFEDEHVELYNLRDDIEEEHDLAHSQQSMAREMKDMLFQWFTEVQARFPRSQR
jgi:arylsulfatase A-like enzyme